MGKHAWNPLRFREILKKVDFESLGFEYYPLGDRNIRLHLCGSHTSVDGVSKFQANLGLTWKVNLLNLKKN